MLYRAILLALVLPFVPSAAAADDNAKRIGCFREFHEPAKYNVTRKKVKDSYRKYIKRTNGRIDLMEYPPVYEEIKTLVEEAHVVIRQVKCD